MVIECNVCMTNQISTFGDGKMINGIFLYRSTGSHELFYLNKWN